MYHHSHFLIKKFKIFVFCNNIIFKIIVYYIFDNLSIYYDTFEKTKNSLIKIYIKMITRFIIYLFKYIYII